MTKSAIVAIIFAVVLNVPGTAHAETDLSTLVKLSNAGSPSQPSGTKSGSAGQKVGLFDIGTQEYVEGEVLVKLDAAHIILSMLQGQNPYEQLETLMSIDLLQTFSSNLSIYSIVGSSSVEEIVAQLKLDPAVEYAEPNYKRYPTAISTNDTHKDLLWALDNTGQTVNGITGTNDSDIDAPEAWLINENIIASSTVAVIDDGVAYNHPDLQGRMWDGSNCKSETGAALGGCTHGYDFVDNDKTPLPSGPHGTHIAGTIAAAVGNDKGIVGTYPYASIMAIRFGYDVASEIKAIDFARQNGVKIINASYGGGAFSQAEYDAIERFQNAGGIFIAAAGNDGSDSDIDDNETFPASHTLSNVISVAASDSTDALAHFSNFGATSVDIAAPGTHIYSTVPSEATLLDENFEVVNTPNLPTGWTKDGAGNNWGTYDLTPGNPGQGVVLYSDLAAPYANNAQTSALSPAYDLSGSTGAVVSFNTRCDTEYSQALWFDYMELYSTDGVTAIKVAQWDEASLDESSGNSTGPSPIRQMELSIPSQHLKADVSLEFRWTTDESNDPDIDYDGCFVDNIEVKKFSDGSDEQYTFMSGTSVAAPFVSGVAALLAANNPTLTAGQIKNTILTTGDTILSHAGKTVSGKRLNAYNALASVLPPKKITSFTIAEQDGSTVINETALTISVAMPFGTDLTALTPTIVIDGVSVSPASNVPQNFTSSVTYTVTSSNGRTQPYLVTVTALPPPPDTVPPVITLNGLSTITLMVGDTFTDPGASAVDAVDGSVDVTIGGDTVNTNTPGNYIVAYNAIDQAGNPAQVTRTVIVSALEADTLPPVITLTGGSVVNLIVGDTFTEGYTAIDGTDGVLTSSVVVGGDTVDTNTAGSYTITYSVTDQAGNNASASRTVNVAELTLSSETSSAVATNAATITWTTSHPATSRVLWDTVSVSDASTSAAGPTNYGYVNSTVEDATLTTSHSVSVVGLTPATAYFFRPVSHGSPEKVGAEVSVTTSAVPPPSGGGGGSSGGGGGGGGSSSSRTNRYAVTINNGAAETKTTAVTLKISPAGNATEMQVSNTSNFEGVSWVPFRSTHKWTLSTDVGTKTVYVRYAKRGKVIGNANDSIRLIGSASTPAAASVPEVLGAATFQFTRDLTLGSYGTDVTELQKILIGGGHLKIAAPTGYYGVITAGAVRAYQTAHTLLVTGVVDAPTRAELNKGTTSPVTTDTKALQLQQLHALLADLMKQLAELQTAE